MLCSEDYRELDSGQTHSPKPTVIILRGDDTLGMQRMVDDLIARISPDPGMVDLNLTRLDGRTASEEDLRTAANSMPFLADRRLVVLSYPLARMASDTTRERFKALLDGLPETSALVLLVDDQIWKNDWETLNDKHWLMRWVEQTGQRVWVSDCLLPRPTEMPGWIRKEAERLGGRISPEGAQALSEHTGTDTLLTSQELTKLLNYTNFERAVEAADVEELCAPGSQADLYGMLDALVEHNSARALRLFHHLLEEQDVMSIFPAIIRQFRQLIQTRDILDEGGGRQQVLNEVDRRAWLAEKLIKHAQRFRISELTAIYRRLLVMDVESKTGITPLDVALDMFFVEMSGA